MRKLGLALFVIALAACGGGGPHPTGPGSGNIGPDVGSGVPVNIDDPQIALDPTIKHGVLPNGLTYYIKANHKPEKRVMLWLAVNAGSVYETDAQQGMAHMVEHLAFNGTKRFPKHDIQDFIERSGMKFGADLNAYTSWLETVYQLQVPTDDPAKVTRGLEVLRDWTTDITFDSQASIDERKIIEEERRLRNSFGLRLAMQSWAVQYAGSPFPKRFPIGTSEVINGATGDKLKAFYQAWYHPENMAVMVAGDIDPAEIEKLIQDKFSDVPKGNNPLPQLAIESTHAPRFVVSRDKENTLSGVSIVYQMPHRAQRTVSDVRQILVDEIFSKLLSERLDILGKRPTSAWTGAAAQFRAQLRPIDELVLQAQAKPGKYKEAVADLTTELARVKQHGFSNEEIQTAVAAFLQLATEQVREEDTRDSSEVVEEMVRHFLEHNALAGPKRELELAKQILPTITSADLVAVAKATEKQGRVVALTAAPDAAVPSEADINAAIASADKPVGDWQAVDLSAPLLASEPTPGKITAEAKLSQGVVVWTLSNGMKVYVKPTEFKKDQILVTATSNGGLSQVAVADYDQAHFAAGAVNAMGFGNYGPEEVVKKLAGKKVSVESSIDAEHEGLGGECSPDDLETLMQLVYAGFTQPRKDEGAFGKWKAQQSQIANIVAANPEATFYIGAFDFLYNGNPRSPLPFPRPGDVEKLDLDKILAQYKARFANAADFELVVVGNVDPAKLKPLVEKYAASLPATKAKRETVADVGMRNRTGKGEKEIKKGSEPKSASILVTFTDQAWSLDLERDAVVLQHVLDIEMLAVLREKLGGTYTVSAQAEQSRNPPQTASIFVLFESSPDNAKKLQDESWATLDKLATSPISDDTLAKIKEQLKKGHEVEETDNGFWLRAISRVARDGDDLDKLVNIDATIARATKAQIQKTARAFVSAKNRSTITLKPEK